MGNFLHLNSKGIVFVFKKVFALLKAKLLFSHFYKPSRKWGKARVVVDPTLTYIFSFGHDETF